MQIKNQSVASFHYTLRDDDENILDSSQGGEPLVYMHGMGNIVPGLEQALVGKRPGDSFKVRVPADQAYGERDERKIHQVSRSQLPKGAEITVGMQFEARGDGEVHVVTVVGLEGADRVILDSNHPLAGVALNFEIAVTEVRDATAEELSHGHVHGPHGHHHH